MINKWFVQHQLINNLYVLRVPSTQEQQLLKSMPAKDVLRIANRMSDPATHTLMTL
jgi:hypothetical protein